jgi:hypothetical protein
MSQQHRMACHREPVVSLQQAGQADGFPGGMADELVWMDAQIWCSRVGSGFRTDYTG